MKRASSVLRSGELAKLSGVSTDTLRHYERLGILARPQRTQSGYRLYPAEAVARVQLIRRALSVGFSLPELVIILRVRDCGGAPCKQVRLLAVTKLKQLGEQLEELKNMRTHLQNLISNWDERLKHTQEGERAGLLEMLDGSQRLAARKGMKR